MAKRLCKYRRVEISLQIGELTKLVSEPKFICQSCARVAASQSVLCKPSALNISALNVGALTLASKPLAEGEPTSEETVNLPSVKLSKQEKRAEKATKKALKKQDKLQKKLSKLLKKSQKLAKKQKKLELKYETASNQANKQRTTISNQSPLH